MHEDLARTRPWDVVDVCDPEGGGRDYAYTVGLTPWAGTELHLWARPTDGLDPGADWRLSHRDLGSLLDEFASLLLEGVLRPGTTLTEVMDGGLTTVTFTVAPPRAAADLGADLLPPAHPVTTIRWTLERHGALSPVPVAEAVVPALLARWSRTATSTEFLRAAARRRGARPPLPPRSWRPVASGGRDPLAPGQRYGPLHPLVLARAGQVLACDGALLHAYLHRLQAAACADTGPAEAVAPLTALARSAGRSAAVAALEADLAGLVDALAGERAPTRRWREAKASFGCACPAHRRATARVLRVRLHEGLLALLLAELVADLAPAALDRLAGGPWAWAIAGGPPADGSWSAPAWAVDLARTLLDPLGPDRLRAAGTALQAAPYDPPWSEAALVLAGLECTRAASSPPCDHPGTGPRLVGTPEEEQRSDLEALLVPLVACAAELGPGAWLTLTAPLRPFVPGLPLEPPLPPASHG